MKIRGMKSWSKRESIFEGGLTVYGCEALEEPTWIRQTVYI